MDYCLKPTTPLLSQQHDISMFTLTYEAVGSGECTSLVQPIWISYVGQRLALSGQCGTVVLWHRCHP